MDKFELLDQRIQELGLTPQEIAERWIENGRVDPFIFSNTKLTGHIPVHKRRKTCRRKGLGSATDVPKVYDDETKQKLFERLRPIIAETFDIDDGMIQPSSNFAMDLGADSLDEVDLMIKVEKNFNCSISDFKAESLRTVQSLIDFLVINGK